MKTTTQLKQNNKIDDEKVKEILAKFPPRYQDVVIENAHREAQEWAKNIRNGGKGLYMHGPTGTGKTYSAYALLKTMQENKVFSRMGNSIDILRDIKEDFTIKAKDPYYRSKFDDWVDYDGVLIIDDIGSEKVTDWVLDTFYALINTRYENKLITIFTSNYSIAELEKRIGDKIVSRIVEMSQFIKFTGDDLRLLK